MNKKMLLNQLIGDKGMSQLALFRRRINHLQGMVSQKTGTIVCKEGISYSIFDEPGKNLFFGYYDLSQFNADGSKMLAHIVPINGDPIRDDAEIVWINPEDGEKHIISKSRAWSWQQGSRLRWHPIEDDTVLFNDIENNKYVTKEINLRNGEARTISDALYDMDSSFHYGISVNFERLQRLRNGYGYSRFGDQSERIARPSNDGVFRVDLSTGEKKLLYSLENLASNVDDKGEHHYINHVSFSPNGSKFLFFHLWTMNAKTPWGMRFCVSNNDGNNLVILEDNVRISHYHWVSEDKIIATRAVKGKHYEYVLYDVGKGTKQVIHDTMLVVDGHPNLFRGKFLTDTYPQSDSFQYIYLADFSSKECNEIIRLYADPLCFGEHRCDLHPRVYANRIITIDSTFKGNKRSIVLFKID